MLEIDAGRFINLSTGDSAGTDHTDDAPDPRAPGLSGCPELLSRLPRCAEDRTHIPVSLPNKEVFHGSFRKPVPKAKFSKSSDTNTSKLLCKNNSS